MLFNEGQKPTIKIHVNSSFQSKTVLNQLCYGIEEEGIPFEIETVEGSSHIIIAYEACQISRLGVGIGVTESHVALHYEKLQADFPLFCVSTHSDLESIRAIGTNGARLVKRMPFRDLHD